MKKFSIPLLFFLLISGVQAASADITPPIEISLAGEVGQSIHNIFDVASTDYSGYIEVSDSWAERGVIERKPTIHNKTASQSGITIRYDKKFHIKKNMKYGFTVILETSVPGIYHGMIYFKPVDAQETLIPVTSVWVNVDTRGIVLNQPLTATNQTELTINGAASTDLKDITIFVNQNPSGIVHLNENWEFNSTISLQEGDNVIAARGESTIDKKEMQSNSIHVTLDTTPPDAPTLTTPPAIVYTNRITVSGNAEADSLVHVFVNRIKENNGVASRAGNFTVSNINLEKGNNTITAIAVDLAGNPSNESAPIYVVYNESAPIYVVYNKTKKKIQLSADKNIITLPPTGDATCNITASVFDENNTLMRNTTLTINFTITSGNATLLSEEVETQDGRAETMVETGNEGDVTIKAETSSLDIEGNSLTITFTKLDGILTNETNETANLSSLDKPEGKSIFDLLSYVVVGVVLFITSLFLYTMRNKNKNTSSWIVSNIKKSGGEYEITVDKDRKKKTIKLNEKLYGQLIKKRKLVLGKHMIMIQPKR